MICPHCHRTIREEDRYLMARGPRVVWPPWAVGCAVAVLLGLALAALRF